MNPIQQFESSVERIKRSEISPKAKGQHLMDVSQAIEHYIHRIDAAKTDDLNPLQIQHLERAKRHLSALSDDAKTLAGQCLATKPRTNTVH